MTKRKIIETIEEYDDDGKLIRKITTETTEDDDVKVQWYPYTVPNYNPKDCHPWWGIYPPVTHIGDPYPCDVTSSKTQ